MCLRTWDAHVVESRYAHTVRPGQLFVKSQPGRSCAGIQRPKVSNADNE